MYICISSKRILFINEKNLSISLYQIIIEITQKNLRNVRVARCCANRFEISLAPGSTFRASARFANFVLPFLKDFHGKFSAAARQEKN